MWRRGSGRARPASRPKASCPIRSPGAGAASLCATASPPCASSERSIGELKPDIVHNVALKPVLLGSIASLGFGETAVVNSLTGLGALFVDGSGSSAFTRKIVEFALGRLLRRARSCTVVQNPEDRDFVRDLGVPSGQIAIIAGSGVDIEKYRALPEPPPPVTAAFVGRMLKHKGVMTLIEAYRRATEDGAKLRLLLAGDCDPENPGSLVPEQLREFASLYGIVWLGHVADVREVWEQAHFAVQPSRGGEGLPKSLLEAAACGRAMVATDVPGCREIAIPDETGILVPVDDADALAKAMLRLAEDKSLRETLWRNSAPPHRDEILVPCHRPGDRRAL